MTPKRSPCDCCEKYRKALEAIRKTGPYVPTQSKRPDVVSTVGWARVRKFVKIATRALQDEQI